jgi:hypothetical protein
MILYEGESRQAEEAPAEEDTYILQVLKISET